MIPLALIIGGTGLVPLLVNLVIIILILWLIFTYIVPLLPEPMRVVAQVLLVVLLIVWLASLIVGCAPIQTPVPPRIAPPEYVPKPKPSPPIPATVGDLKSLATQAADAYIAKKNGDTNFAWSIAAGLRAYQTLVKIPDDVRKVAADFSEGKKAGLTLADQLANLFATSPLPPPKKAEVIASAVEKAAAK